MGFYLSPLVKVNEIDLSNTVPAVATSIATIVVRNSYKGDELKKTFVTNEAELARALGEPTDYSYRDWLSAAGYLKYGNKLYVTRALETNSTFSQLLINSGSGTNATDQYDMSGVTPGTIVLSDFSGLDYDTDNFGEPGAVTFSDGYDMFLISKSRGSWGNNIRVAFLDRESQYAITQSVGNTGVYVAPASGLSYEVFKDIDNLIDYNVSNPVDNVTPELGSRNFLVLVQCKDQRSSVYTTKEVFNVSIDPLAIDDQGQSMYVESVINQRSEYIKISVGSTLTNLSTIPVGIDATGFTQDKWYYMIGGGGETATVSIGDIETAYDLYSNPEEIDVNLFIDTAFSDGTSTIKDYLISLCENRMDCMAVLDVPFDMVYSTKGSETTKLLEWIRVTFNPNTSYASVYANWLEVYDKYNQKYRWIPSSGYMAGIYAHTDDVSEAWFAPAGLNRAIITGVRRLAWNPSLGHRDLLYSNKLNPIVSFAGQGKVVWGQKTLLSKSSAFDRVNVRRLFIVLEKAISTACKYFIFEPNDPATRNILTNMITPFLRDVKARRGIYDFKVVSDDTINTPERIDRNELWVNIFIKPTKTAEYIILNFIATKTGASFSELSGNV